MGLRPSVPRPPAEDVGEWKEVFDHPIFLDGTPEARRDIMRRSAEAKYRSEREYPWDAYFGRDLAPGLAGRRLLDLGCFTGGRGVAWAERYRAASLAGVDVTEPFVEAARQFAAAHGIAGEFRVGHGETLPFAPGSVDAVLAFDVFEHVQDLAATLAECRRVLVPGGRLYTVFPGRYHPLEHHLNLATRMPALNWIFGGATLVAAYDEILAARGPEAAWYRRRSPRLEPWERGNTTNGTTHAGFRRLVAAGGWRVLADGRQPVGSIGRNAARHPGLRRAARLLRPLTAVPGVRELFLHRIAMILETSG